MKYLYNYIQWKTFNVKTLKIKNRLTRNRTTSPIIAHCIVYDMSKRWNIQNNLLAIE